jgi:hypothetical protein
MTETNHNERKELEPASGKAGRRCDSLGWAVFFIWVGIALAADVGWGVGFIGVGLIILGKLAAREWLAPACRRQEEGGAEQP